MTTPLFAFEKFPDMDLERVRLRQIRESDISSLFAMLSDHDVMKYNDDPIDSMEEARRRYELMEPEFREKRLIRWAIASKEDDRLIGTIILSNWSKKFRSADIGYDLLPAYWGQGLMTEVLRNVITFGFEQMDLNRLEATFATENIGSKRVLEKNGFTYEGTMREKWYWSGKYWDGIMMGLLRKNYLLREDK